MSGEVDLGKLLAGLKVFRHDGLWAFETGDEPIAEAIMSFREREGWTAIVPAEDKVGKDNQWVWLELAVHSDLNAVGFIATVSAALAKAGVPCNAVAAFYHDHIFVPAGKADIAVEALKALSQG